jgi:hypothetical protein
MHPIFKPYRPPPPPAAEFSKTLRILAQLPDSALDNVEILFALKTLD